MQTDRRGIWLHVNVQYVSDIKTNRETSGQGHMRRKR